MVSQRLWFKSRTSLNFFLFNNHVKQRFRSPKQRLMLCTKENGKIPAFKCALFWLPRSEHISGACSKLYLKKNRQNKTRQKSSDLSEPHGILTKVIVYAIVVTSEGFPLILNTTDILIEPAMISRY